LESAFESPVCGRLHDPGPGCEFGIQSDVETGPFGGRTGAGAVRLQRQKIGRQHAHVGDDVRIPGNHAFVGASFRIGPITGAERPYLQLAQLTPGDGVVRASTLDIRLSLKNRTLGIGVFRTKQERYGTWRAPTDRWFTTILEMDYGRTVPLRLWVYDDRDALVDTVSLTADTTTGDRALPRQTIGGTVSTNGPVLQYTDDWWIATVNLGPIHVRSGDLSLDTDRARDVPRGSDATVAFRVRNEGPDPSTGTALSLLPPDGVTVVSITPGQGSCTGSVCRLGTVPPGGVVTVQMVVRPGQTGTISIPAAVAAGTADPFDSDNAATATLLVSEP
jgi:hypothetical protein